MNNLIVLKIVYILQLTFQYNRHTFEGQLSNHTQSLSTLDIH